MATFKSFEDLACWKEAKRFRNLVKDNIIPKFPASEKYELKSQIRRSSRSVGNNIAEGFGRYHFQENIQFCRISRGSLNESLDHTIVAFDENYITEQDLKELRELHNKTLLILNGYIKYLKSKK
jgi:four helix bundle protein